MKNYVYIIVIMCAVAITFMEHFGWWYVVFGCLLGFYYDDLDSVKITFYCNSTALGIQITKYHYDK